MNSNPFEPVGTEPAELKPTDSEPDNFAANSNELNNSDDSYMAKPPRPAVMLDGISPSLAPSQIEKNLEEEANSLISNTAAINDNNPSDDSFRLNSTPSDSLLDDKSDDKSGFLDNLDKTENTPGEESVIAAAPAKQEDEKSDKKADKKHDSGAKPPKQFTISIFSILLFILAAGGIAGSVYFYMQNDANLNKLKDSQAKVAELSNNGTDASTSDNKTTSQFDALQDKIVDLTKQNQDKQKTLDADKTKIDDLTKKNDELTKSNEALTKKVQDISDLTTKVDTLINKLNSTDTTTP